jgi:hypothetical protein
MQIGFAEICLAQISLAQIGLDQVNFAQIGSKQAQIAEICPAEIWPFATVSSGLNDSFQILTG